MFIRRCSRLAFAVSLATVFALAAPSATWAAPLFTPGIAFSPAAAPTNPIQIGSRIQLVTSVSATAIGAYVSAHTTEETESPYITAGLTNANFTGLLYSSSDNFASNYNLIEKVLIPIGTSVDASGFAYANFLSPHTLTAGQQYVITVWKGLPTVASPEEYRWWEKTPVHATVDASATLIASHYVLNSTGAPINPFTGYNEFGANLQISPIPEPTSLFLSGAGLIGLTLFRRRRYARS